MSSKNKRLTIDENILAERLAAFQPDPLVPIQTDEEKSKDDEIEILAVQEDENTFDLAKINFLNVLNNNDIKQKCEDIIRKYGVGTCGPRAFYGTTDVHLELEEKIAKFLEMEESIVYSYGFVTISSSVAAYCKKNDVIFTSTDCNIPMQHGFQMARSNIIYFDHQNPESFAEAVNKIVQKEHQSKKKSRKFLVVEGVSWKTGKILPLPDLLKIAEEHKIRIFLEESYSIGILGDTGKGLMEYFNIEPWRIDMIIATLESALGSIGGFCAGSHLTIEHQRLSGSGYIFSASLPTFLVQAAIEAINIIETDKPHHKLRKLAENFQDMLIDIGYEVQSDPCCPFKVVNIKENNNEVKCFKEKEVHKYCRENGLHFILHDDCMVMNLNVNLLDDLKRYEQISLILRDAYRKVFGQY